jgi:hypothetical protein
VQFTQTFNKAASNTKEGEMSIIPLFFLFLFSYFIYFPPSSPVVQATLLLRRPNHPLTLQQQHRLSHRASTSTASPLSPHFLQWRASSTPPLHASCAACPASHH